MSTITFANFKKKLVRTLDDAIVDEASKVAGSQYTSDQLSDAVDAGLQAIISKCWKGSVSTLSVAGITHTLPSNFVSVQGVRSKTSNKFIERLELAPDIPVQTGLRWYLFPSGSISFTSSVDADEYEVIYSSLWTIPSAEADFIECPDIAIPSVLYFAAAHCLMVKGSSASTIRTFNTKVDSGNPEDNSLQKQAFAFRRMANEEMDKIPMPHFGRN